MVTKPGDATADSKRRCVLAKIHMVTKRSAKYYFRILSCVLAKIHMVTKPGDATADSKRRCVLAKIHMVTKH